MDKRLIRNRAIILALLLLLIAALAFWYAHYLKTRDLGIPAFAAERAQLAAPQYQYSISGTGNGALRAPLGVAVAKDGRVYVTDSQNARIEVFATAGQLLSQFTSLAGGQKPARFPTLLLPVSVAINPVDGNVYVTDRGRSGLFVFTPSGRYLREIIPYDKPGYQWKPNALAFAPDGTLYVSDVFYNHQIWRFDPSGATVLKFGKSGQVLDNVNDRPGVFWFPNGLAVGRDLRIWVGDSDNRRIQIFTPDGKFSEILATSGDPRGLAFWRKGSEERLIMVDALANFMTVYAPDGRELVQFGERGRGLGQFMYPNGDAVSADGTIFVTDRENDRVQVWAWAPTITAPAAAVAIGLPLAVLTPLLLIPLWFLLRKRTFFATDDFLAMMVEKEKLNLMTGRKRFSVLPATYEVFKEIRQGDAALADILEPEEFSPSDVRDLMERFEIGETEAMILSSAKRKRTLCTDSQELRRLALPMKIQVIDHLEFIKENERT